jgi:hypothetical protein
MWEMCRGCNQPELRWRAVLAKLRLPAAEPKQRLQGGSFSGELRIAVSKACM